jgi:Xaa-Pro aminopeptidase
MLARNLNDEVSVVIVDPRLGSVVAEAVVDSAVEEILAAAEEILVVVEEILVAVASAVVAVALAAPSVIAEVVLTVVSTRDVSHPRDRAREMRTAIELAELRKSLV